MVDLSILFRHKKLEDVIFIILIVILMKYKDVQVGMFSEY